MALKEQDPQQHTGRIPQRQSDWGPALQICAEYNGWISARETYICGFHRLTTSVWPRLEKRPFDQDEEHGNTWENASVDTRFFDQPNNPNNNRRSNILSPDPRGRTSTRLCSELYLVSYIHQWPPTTPWCFQSPICWWSCNLGYRKISHPCQSQTKKSPQYACLLLQSVEVEDK